MTAAEMGKSDQIGILQQSNGRIGWMTHAKTGAEIMRNTICVDTETTGLDPKEDEILTISIVDWNGAAVFDGKFKPKRKRAWAEAAAVNGITPESTEGLPAIDGFLPELRRIFAEADEVIGYNLPFDLAFLEEVGVQPRPDAKLADAMLGFAEAYGEPSESHPGEFRWKKLTFATEYVGHEWTGAAHGSMADALATLAIQKWIEANSG